METLFHVPFRNNTLNVHDPMEIPKDLVDVLINKQKKYSIYKNWIASCCEMAMKSKPVDVRFAFDWCSLHIFPSYTAMSCGLVEKISLFTFVTDFYPKIEQCRQPHRSSIYVSLLFRSPFYLPISKLLSHGCLFSNSDGRVDSRWEWRHHRCCLLSAHTGVRGVSAQSIKHPMARQDSRGRDLKTFTTFPGLLRVDSISFPRFFLTPFSNTAQSFDWVQGRFVRLCQTVPGQTASG